MLEDDMGLPWYMTMLHVSGAQNRLDELGNCACCDWTCAENYYRVGDQCRICTRCPANSFKSAGCEGSENTVCSPCSDPSLFSCAQGEYLSGCSHDGDRACLDCRACEDGQYVSGGCTGTQNTICSACSACPSGQYATGGCDGVIDTICTTCAINGTDCPTGEYFSTECTTFEPPRCVPCRTDCSATTQYLSATCEGDTFCKTCNPCSSTQYRTGEMSTWAPFAVRY